MFNIMKLPEVGEPRLIDIHQAFAGTEHGEKLAEEIRYAVYKPEEVSPQRWVELLGADVNNLTHLPLTYGLTRAFINSMDELAPGVLDEEDKAILKIAALIHDWGESIVGDKTYSDKTDEDIEQERAEFIENLSRFYPGEADEVADWIEEALKDVIFTPDTRLGVMFNAIERLGYVRTALRAQEHIREGTAPDCEDGLKWLVADVLSNKHPSALTHVAEALPPIKKYLLNQQDLINEAFGSVEPEVFLNYTGEKALTKPAAVEDCRRVWDAWLRSI